MLHLVPAAVRRVLVAAAVLAGAACAAVGQSTIIKIDGSSTVYPITEAVAEEFQTRARANRVTVGIAGTGGGFKKFARGEIDVAAASRPIKKEEIEACAAAGVEFIELPVAFDALTVVINKENTWARNMTVDQLRKIWEPAAQGVITRWNQIDPSWPDAEIKLYGPGTDSGTFEYFTEAIVGKAKSSRGDYTASEDDNVLVQGVASDVNAIGYFGYAYYAENTSRLKGLPIVNPRTGKAVEPSAANVENASYQPLSRPIFIYVKLKSLERPEVREFVEFYMKNADTLVREVKYVPLPKAIYDTNLKHARDKKVGSVFGGKNEVGITVEEIMKREARM